MGTSTMVINVNITNIIPFVDRLKDRLHIVRLIRDLPTLVGISKNLILNLKVSGIVALIAVFQIAIVDTTIRDVLLLIHLIGELTFWIGDSKQ